MQNIITHFKDLSKSLPNETENKEASNYVTQPLTSFLREFPLPWEILLFLF